jgi:hypothetical protein
MAKKKSITHSAGKGDAYRPVDMKKYRENYDKIFGKKKKGTKGDSK